MSQIMESMVNRGVTQNQNGSEVVPYQPPQQSLDFIKVLWRWKWLPILGALIGAGVGYMFYTKMPELFQSSAMVQVGFNLPAQNNLELYDPDKVAAWTNRNDEARVIKSQKVLGIAVKVGELQQYFPDLTPTGIVFELMDEDIGVKVIPAETSDRVQTDQLLISYVSRNPDTAHAVVDAVVQGYQAFLTEEYRTVDDEVLKYFKQTEEGLAAKIDELNKNYADLKEKKTDVIWNLDEAIDPYLENYRTNSAYIADLRREHVHLRAKLEQVNIAKKNQRRPEDLLLVLSDGSETGVKAIWNELFGSKGLGAGSDRLSDQLRTMTMIPLKVREQELLKTLGANHPTIQTIRSQIEAVEQQIELALEREKRVLQGLGGSGETASNDPNNPTSPTENEAPKIGDASPIALPGSNSTPSTDLANAGAIGKSPLDLLGAANPSSSADPEGQVPPTNISEETIQVWVEMMTNAITQRYQQLGQQIKELDAIAEEDLRKSQELQKFFAETTFLKESIENMKNLHLTFNEKVKAVELTPTSANQKVLRELNPASEGLLYGPFPARYVCGGAALGILLMSGLAILMDLADRSYRSPDEIVTDLGKPVLGHVPAMDLPNIKKVVNSVDASIITLHHSRGRIAEAFRSVRTGLFFSSRGSELKVVQVTSPVPGDGKSTLSANLAVTMAQSGRRVLLVDADFRRPRLHKLFGIEVQAGLAQLVSGEVELDDAIYTTCIANLTMMPGGKRPNNPAELLSSNRFGELVEILREKYDIIIIDTPPLLAVSDPSVVASLVDGVVLTMRLRRNVKPLASRAFRVLESVDAQILGVVVNGVSTEAAYGGYGYNYSYNDYRYSYRSNYNYGYGYRKYTNYAEYSAGYIEDKQTDAVAEVDSTNDAHPQS